MFVSNQKIYIVDTTGALGDTISTFPILKILSDRGHIERMFVDERYLDLHKLYFPNVVRLQDAIRTIPASEITPDIPKSVIDPRTGEARFLDYPLIPGIPVVDTLKAYPTSMHSHLVDCFSMSICDTILKESQKDYPTVDRSRLPKNPFNMEQYVVIACGSTTEHRRMLPEVFRGLVDYYRGLGLDVVLLGKRDHELQCNGTMTRPQFDYDMTDCVDMIDKTSILGALSIMNDAHAVVGLDNGLIHLAALTDVPIVAGYTTVDPYYRMPYRHGEKGWGMRVVEPDSECKYCQTESYCTYGIDFLRCQTRTLECMKSLTLDQWMKAING
jgi:ADP-heptose:LPS heptosyltransferase